jgi:hypothetical protein
MKNLTDFSVTSRPLRVGRSFNLGSLFSDGVSGGGYAAAKPSGIFADQEGQVPAEIGQSVARIDDIGPNLQHVSQPSSALRPQLGRAPVAGRRNKNIDTEFEIIAPASGPFAGPIGGGSLSIGAGVSCNLVGYGIANGIRYVELRFFGTSTSQAATLFFNSASNQAPASVGQTWTQSVFLQRVAGSSVNQTPSLRIQEYSNAGFLTQTVLQNIGPTETATRFSATATLGNASTTFIRGLFAIGASGEFDVTYRIYAPQLELGPEPTPYQRVGNALDVTEAGFPSPSYLRFDLSDDVLPTTYSAGFSGDVVVSGRQGSWFERDVTIAAGGAMSIGPRSFTGAPQDVLAALGDIVGWVSVGRTLTEGEVSRLLRYFRGYGARGLLVPGQELGDPALLGKRAGTDGTVTREGGILTFASAAVNLSTSVAQEISGLTVGATYRFSGRMRRVSGSGPVFAQLRTASGGGGTQLSSISFSNDEWNDFSLLFTADATARFFTYNASLAQTIEVDEAAHSIRKLEAD